MVLQQQTARNSILLTLCEKKDQLDQTFSFISAHPCLSLVFSSGQRKHLCFTSMIAWEFWWEKGFSSGSYYSFYAGRHQKTAKFSICWISSVWTGRHFPVLELGCAILFTRMANLPTLICKMLHRYRWKPWKMLGGYFCILNKMAKQKETACPYTGCSEDCSVAAQCILPSGQLQKITKSLA